MHSWEMWLQGLGLTVEAEVRWPLPLSPLFPVDCAWGSPVLPGLVSLWLLPPWEETHSLGPGLVARRLPQPALPLCSELPPCEQALDGVGVP